MPGHILKTTGRGFRAFTNDPPIHFDEESQFKFILDKFWIKRNTQYKTPEIHVTDKIITHDLAISPVIKLYDTTTNEEYYGVSDPVKRMDKIVTIELYTLDRSMLYDCKKEIIRILDFCRVEPIKDWDFTYTVNSRREGPRAGNYHFLIDVGIHKLAKGLMAARYNGIYLPILTNPIVTITTPSPGNTITGVMTVNGYATSTIAISTITPYLDGIQIGNVISGSIGSWNYDTQFIPDAQRQLTIKATDIYGATGIGGELINTYNTYTPPVGPLVVDLLNPTEGETIIGEMIVTASITGGNGFTTASLFIGTMQIESQITNPGPYTWTVDTTPYIGHSETVLVTAVDTADDQSSSFANVIIQAPTPPAIVSYDFNDGLQGWTNRAVSTSNYHSSPQALRVYKINDDLTYASPSVRFSAITGSITITLWAYLVTLHTGDSIYVGYGMNDPDNNNFKVPPSLQFYNNSGVVELQNNFVATGATMAFNTWTKIQIKLSSGNYGNYELLVNDVSSGILSNSYSGTNDIEGLQFRISTAANDVDIYYDDISINR